MVPQEMSFMDAIRQALHDEMESDGSVFLLGEDIGEYGGAFKVTRGLYDRFGPKRVVDTPLSEVAIAGACIGAAMAGMRPVAELMFSDFLTIAMDQIVNNAAKMYYLHDGRLRMSMVVRTPCGAGTATGPHHSQSLESLFIHIPGLKVALPSTPNDAYWLLRQSIRSDSPVLFFEPRMLYRSRGLVDTTASELPFGKAAVRRVGSDVTLVAMGAMVPRALEAGRVLGDEGIDVEIIDLRTLVPMDIDEVLHSLEKTQRLVVVEEGCKTGGIGAEIAARVAEEALDLLDAPIKRVAAPDTPVPACAHLEQAFIPGLDRIVGAVKQIA